MKTIVSQKEHLKEIANLHKTGIPTGFISSLPTILVKRLYGSIMKTQILISLVSDDESEVLGFVSCATDSKQLYRNFFLRNFWLLGPALLPRFFQKGFIKKLFETKNASESSKLEVETQELPELLSVVVKPGLQASGLGKLLLDSLEAELRSRSVKKYKVVAGEELVSANKYYQKYGFKLAGKTEIHKGDISNIYVKEFSDAE